MSIFSYSTKGMVNIAFEDHLNVPRRLYLKFNKYIVNTLYSNWEKNCIFKMILRYAKMAQEKFSNKMYGV